MFTRCTVIQLASTVLSWLAFCVFHDAIQNFVLVLNQLFIKVFNLNHMRCR